MVLPDVPHDLHYLWLKRLVNCKEFYLIVPSDLHTGVT